MPKTPQSPFADAAERLDRYIQDVRTRQHDATGAKGVPLAPRPRFNPDADWLRDYASHVIRPALKGESPRMPEHVAPPLPKRPRLPDLPEIEGESGPIGARIGKPAKRRGALARLFRRGRK